MARSSHILRYQAISSASPLQWRAAVFSATVAGSAASPPHAATRKRTFTCGPNSAGGSAFFLSAPGWADAVAPPLGRCTPPREAAAAPTTPDSYAAVLLTDTGFLRNPHYHQPSDRLETLDLEFLTGVATSTAATALVVASARRASCHSSS